MFSWIIESRGIQAWRFCNRVLCASGVQLDVEANRLVGASSGCRYAFKAILSTSFFCEYEYGPAFILWRLCFVIVPCSVSVDMVLHSFFGGCVF